jgi:hypothetical protein
MLSTLVPAVWLPCGGHHTKTHFVDKIEAHKNSWPLLALSEQSGDTRICPLLEQQRTSMSVVLG